MRTQQLLLAIVAMALVMGACANAPAESPATSAAPASAAPSSAAPGSPSADASSAPPTASATPAGTATTAPTEPASSSASSCTPELPTAISANWTTLQAHDSDFTFKFPATWDKLYGAFVFKTSSLLDAETFADTGLPAASETRADLVRAPGVGLPNASVLIVPGVVSPTATVFQRQVNRFSAIPDIKIINSNLTACIGGESALGVEFTFNKDTTFQQSWYMVKAGRSYDIQWLAAKDSTQTDLVKEIFRTWQWAPNIPVATPLPRPAVTPAPSGSAAPSDTAIAQTSFVTAGMALNVDTAAAAANPKDFVTSIPKTSTAFYAVFVLKPGLSGQVNGALMQGDKVLVTLSLQYGPKNTWGDFRLNAANGVAPGDYTMVITFVPNGDTINLPFSVK